mmetsp:Transcript_11943/g.33691  ORF Transcript_11943/g.33691 Transcript_11943/m.33691 type:complete len:266 (+) Transcript_11943:3860-4657(+)
MPHALVAHGGHPRRRHPRRIILVILGVRDVGHKLHLLRRLRGEQRLVDDTRRQPNGHHLVRSDVRRRRLLLHPMVHGVIHRRRKTRRIIHVRHHRPVERRRVLRDQPRRCHGRVLRSPQADRPICPTKHDAVSIHIEIARTHAIPAHVHEVALQRRPRRVHHAEHPARRTRQHCRPQRGMESKKTRTVAERNRRQRLDPHPRIKHFDKRLERRPVRQPAIPGRRDQIPGRLQRRKPMREHFRLPHGSIARDVPLPRVEHHEIARR